MAKVEHVCKHEGEFGAMQTLLSNHEKTINGNGNKGLRDIVTGLNTTVETLTTEVGQLRTVISGFNRFQTETEVEIKLQEQSKAKKQIRVNNIQWLIGTAAMVLIYFLDKIT